MAGKSKFTEHLITLKCSVCNRKNYHTTKNKKSVERKLNLKKYCKWCKKHIPHVESKMRGK
ncbi:MAG: 50S ribosomal protein L33 [Candidatus Colwellbacteria bacterium CG10_big_fil_rev_8_21_14_0_10_41_28]|uniref:Large ribosomal subunit protein bL33 n=1 Tax=Candidatus Colwellbacteria bacterium CG10_big_fil_rev_8_21_14_0_10_41_28 TaxID=1974539 RepID=A0A2H0VJM0_9BACT|nr:MAG: 50S ribosomal protein L33 [Candidatus Colwellbacteria bacterium CG10_big_fil_rev_8_21_14_0_10_41_28]